MRTRQQRHNRLQLPDDDIGRALAESQHNGELRSAPEVAVMRQIAALRLALHDAADSDAKPALQRRLVELQQHLALRLERWRAPRPPSCAGQESHNHVRTQRPRRMATG